jgi:CBS domain-containing protein
MSVPNSAPNSSPNAAPNSLILATVEHLSRFAPFGSMEREHLAWMAERLKLGYYSKGETVLSPESGEVGTFFIIKQGEIHGEQDVVRAQDDAAWLELHEGECFPLGALLSKRPVNSTYKAGIDTFCYELATSDFHEMLHRSAPFHDFCTRRLANLLEQSKQVIQAQYTKSSSEQQSMTSPLSAIVRRAPVSCTPETPMRQVLETMNSLGIGSMVAVDPQQRPLGIFTLHDVLSRVTLPNLDLNTPFSAVMSPDPVTLPPHALAYEAALVMARHGFRHILVEEQGKLIGLLSEKDLFTLQRVGLRQLSGVIRKAADLDTLKHAAEDIRQLAHNMLAQGITAEQLTQIISTLNDLLTTRIIEMELEADSAARAVEFCWLALGSEGRLEQTLNTDQDNGILFSVPEGQDAESIRNVMLPFAKRINLALAECGFPLCGGEVMASNPKWCLSLSEWKNTFDKWIYHGAPMDLLHSTIFFDFRPMFGAVRMAEELREWLAEAAAKNTRFLHQLAVNALRNKPPLGIVRDFVTSDGMIDLKMNGITPFVDAARIFSLAHGVSATNTLQRLRDAGEKLRMSAQDIDALCDAFLYIQLLRLRLHHSQCQAGEKLTNKVDPETLNALDSRILREAFRQARKLQTKLALDYQV